MLSAQALMRTVVWPDLDVHLCLLRTLAGGGAGNGLFRTAASPAALNDGQAFVLHLSPSLRMHYEDTLLAAVEQAQQQQRAARGALTAAVLGPARPRQSALGAAAALADAFRQAIDEVERNHATRVCVCVCVRARQQAGTAVQQCMTATVTAILCVALC